MTSSDNHLPPLAVSPRKACVLLDCGNTHLYQLLRDGELESYLDGRARRITMDSIKRRVARLLASASATGVSTEVTHQPRPPGRTAHDEWADRNPRAKPQKPIGTPTITKAEHSWKTRPKREDKPTAAD
jgi:excisionase family DNA binding protein